MNSTIQRAIYFGTLVTTVLVIWVFLVFEIRFEIRRIETKLDQLNAKHWEVQKTINETTNVFKMEKSMYLGYTLDEAVCELVAIRMKENADTSISISDIQIELTLKEVTGTKEEGK